MFFKLFLLFTCVPLIEIYLLIKVGGMIGALNTIGLVLLTGAIGAAMAQSQGFSVMYRIQEATHQGKMPVEELIDGAFILVGGFLLITPGILTDAFGFMCLIPVTRAFFKHYIRKYLEKQAKQSKFHAHIDLRD